LTTSHEEKRESGMTYLINGQLRFGYTAREFNHSHPNNTPYPSGSFDHPKTGQPAGTWGDVGFANGVSNIFKGNVKYNIYTPKDKSYINFNGNSSYKNYGYGKMFHEQEISFDIIYDHAITGEWKSYYLKEYAIKDTTFYNQLCSIVFSDTTCSIDYNYFMLFGGYESRYFDYVLMDYFNSNFNISVVLADNYSQSLGFFYLNEKICFIKKMPTELILHFLTSTKNTRKFHYWKDDNPDYLAPYLEFEPEWNMELHKEGNIEIKRIHCR
jgi:hypothetical protein